MSGLWGISGVGEGVGEGAYPDPPSEAARDPVLFLMLLLVFVVFLVDMVGKDCWTSVR